MTIIAPTDPNIIYSPYNWDVSAGGAKTLNSGAYFRVTFSGDPNTLAATFNITNQPVRKSKVGFRVDGGPWQDYKVAASVPLTIPANTWAVHTVEMVVAATTESVNRWNDPQGPAVIFTGLDADVTVTTKAGRKRTLTGIAFGDSITEGVRTLNMDAADDVDRNDTRLAWGYPLGDLLGAEIGVIGMGGVGLSKSGSGNVPKFPDSAPYLWAGKARTYPVDPDFIVAHVGANDWGSDNAAVVTDTTALLNHWLSATTKAKIFMLPNWKQTKAPQIQQGIAASSDPSRVVYVDTTGWWNTADASDALHPYGYVNISDLAPRIAGVVRANIEGYTATNYFIRNSAGQAVPVG